MSIKEYPTSLPVPKRKKTIRLKTGLTDSKALLWGRRVRTYPEQTYDCSMRLTASQLPILKEFYETTLNNGCFLFNAYWLDFYRLRFIGGYTITMKNINNSKVGLSFELLAGYKTDYWECW